MCWITCLWPCCTLACRRSRVLVRGILTAAVVLCCCCCCCCRPRPGCFSYPCCARHPTLSHPSLSSSAAAMVLMSVLNSCLVTLTNAERRGKRQVLIRPVSKVVVKFLQVMMKHGMTSIQAHGAAQPLPLALHLSNKRAPACSRAAGALHPRPQLRCSIALSPICSSHPAVSLCRVHLLSCRLHRRVRADR